MVKAYTILRFLKQYINNHYSKNSCIPLFLEQLYHFKKKYQKYWSSSSAANSCAAAPLFGVGLRLLLLTPGIVHTIYIVLHKHKSILASHILEQLRKSSFSEPSARRQRRSTTRYVWNSPQKQYWKLSLERPFAHKQRISLLLLLQNSNRVLLSNNTITAHNIRKTCLCCYCITLVFCHCALCVCQVYRYLYIYILTLFKNKTKTVFYFGYESATCDQQYTKISGSGSACTLPYHTTTTYFQVYIRHI